MSPKTCIRVYRPLQCIYLPSVCCSLSELHRTASRDQQVLPHLRCSGPQGKASPQHPVRETNKLEYVNVVHCWHCIFFLPAFANCLCYVLCPVSAPFFLPTLLPFDFYFLSTYFLLSVVSYILSFSLLWLCSLNTRWFKYDRDKLWLVYTQTVPVIFEPPCTFSFLSTVHASCILLCHFHCVVHYVGYFELCALCLVSRTVLVSCNDFIWVMVPKNQLTVNWIKLYVITHKLC